MGIWRRWDWRDRIVNLQSDVAVVLPDNREGNTIQSLRVTLLNHLYLPSVERLVNHYAPRRCMTLCDI